MSSLTERSRLARYMTAAGQETFVLWTFALALCLSALLLFSVQPLFAKIVLPKLGGSPSVWAVSMCFFQAVLLAGYCYAHAINRFVAPRTAPLLHLFVIAAAFLALPIALPETWSEPPAGDAYFWLIGLLAVGVGLPFFAVSANAPLLQAWFVRTGHPAARDPYFLYGASNLGSLAALLAYPVLFEPFFGLESQANLWTKGFLALGFMISACGLLMLSLGKFAQRAETSATSHDAVPEALPTLHQRLAWIAYAFVPSGLLVAFTSYVTTDIASAPFLWVLPLAAFLLTFILVFKDKPSLSHDVLLRVQPVLVAGMMIGLTARGNTGWVLGCIFGALGFFVTTMVCHRELYEHRPAPRHLTEFYLWMSLGGVLGGIFAALLAPKLFNAIYEFPILLVLGMACRPGAMAALRAIGWPRVAILAAGGVAALYIFGVASRMLPSNAMELPVLAVLLAGASMMILSTRKPDVQLVSAACMACAIALLPSMMNRGDSERSFFGIHRVVEMQASGTLRVLMHGTTAHGAERITDAAGKPTPAPVPATYYYAGGPMASGLRVRREAMLASGQQPSVGIVGLGAGSMACHSRASEAWRFYEIDPVVVKIARDPKRFRFLSECRPNADIVLGDARLTLAKEQPATFDYLVIDAFASDAVPVHLLTTEALSLYLSKLRPNGLLALHVSNRHLDLIAVASTTALALPGVHAVVVDDKVKATAFDKARSQVVFLSRSEETLAPILGFNGARPAKVSSLAPWTDDFSNIIRAIFAKYAAR